jgi:outer membrane protein OmpA-like peptidoglycan-associated protein
MSVAKTQQLNQSLTLDIKFANNSAVIPVNDLSEIKRVADFLNAYPDTKVLIEGHTSKVGSASLNKALSKRRASALSVALVNEYGIAQSRVSTKGYGFERPKDPSDSDEAHAVNRRIVAELSGIKQVDDMIWTIYTVDQIE